MTEFDPKAFSTAGPAERAALRHQEIDDFGVFDEEAQQVLDRISRVASAALRMPITYVSFVDNDRQWVRTAVGIDTIDVPLEDSFCIHTIEAGQMLVVEDPEADDRFSHNRFVTGAPVSASMPARRSSPTIRSRSGRCAPSTARPGPSPSTSATSSTTWRP